MTRSKTPPAIPPEFPFANDLVIWFPQAIPKVLVSPETQAKSTGAAPSDDDSGKEG